MQVKSAVQRPQVARLPGCRSLGRARGIDGLQTHARWKGPVVENRGVSMKTWMAQLDHEKMGNEHDLPMENDIQRKFSGRNFRVTDF